MLQGIYRHYKGNLYRVYAIATHTETGDHLVCYQSLYGDFGNWARPLEMFTGQLEHEGKIVNRFTFVDDNFNNPPNIRQ